MADRIKINDAGDLLEVNAAGDKLLWQAPGNNLDISANVAALTINPLDSAVVGEPAIDLQVAAGSDALQVATQLAQVAYGGAQPGLPGYVFPAWKDATFIDLMDDLDKVVTGLGAGAYRFYVKAIDSVRNESANAAFADVLISAPLPPSNLTGFEAAESIRLRWDASATTWVQRYRVEYVSLDSPPKFSGARLAALVDSTQLLISDVEVGSYRFYVYALDDGDPPLQSSAVTVDIDVTSDQLAFKTDVYEFENPVVTNMHSWTYRDFPTTDRTFYVTAMAGDSFENSPSTFAAYDDEPLANFHSTGSTEWLSEVQDFGTSFSGTWVLDHSVEALSGDVTVELWMSNTAPTSPFIGGNAVLVASSTSVTVPGEIRGSGTYRYGQVRVLAAGTETALVTTPTMKLQLEAVPFEESGTGTSQGSGAETVSLSRQYGVVKDVQITAKASGSPPGPSTAVYDNIQLSASPVSTFDVYVFDADGNQVAVDFYWRWKGI